MIAYDSPVNEKDEVDITPIVEAAEKVAEYLGADVPLVITSQLPLGSSEMIEEKVQKLNGDWKSGVVYTPENLKLGQAIERFIEPDMLVLGANNKAAQDAAMELYKPFDTEKVPMDLKSSEMVKHALNTFLATSITFINEIAALSDRLGADAVAVGKALKLDVRIGKKALLRPGLGFSGGTLARDVTQLTKFSDEYDYPGELLRAITSINASTFDEVVLKLKNVVGDLKGKTIGVLGITYKPGTSTLRRSAAVAIMNKLKDEGAASLAYDPKADKEEVDELKDLFAREDSIEEMAGKSDALVLITEWPEFNELDFAAVAKSMKTPLIVDAKNHFDPEEMRAAGFEYQGFGRK